MAVAANHRIATGCVAAYVGGGTLEPNVYTAPAARGRGLASHLAALVVRDAFGIANAAAAAAAVATAAAVSRATGVGAAPDTPPVADAAARPTRPAVSWTCDADNAASRRIAAKLGFVEEGRVTLFGQPGASA